MFSVGVLSWKAHDTLRRTLASYRYLLPLADEAVIFFNSITDEDRAIAKEFGFRAEGVPENLGILGGTLSLVRSLRGDVVLLLQNDNPVNVNPEVLKERIFTAKRLLLDGTVDMIRMRDRFDSTFSDKQKYLRYWPDEGCEDSLCLRLRRYLRPLKARRMKGRACAVLKNPELRHPEIFVEKNEVLITDSRFVNYSDQPFMAFRKDVLKLLEWADAHKKKCRLLNGLPSQETIINGPYWRNLKLKIAVTDGIFAHARFDDSFRPCHKAYNKEIIV
jgi:hypothetical protein